jgi:maltose-binding protein MalE
MKVYAVHFINKVTENYIAYGYTHKDGKYYFHKQADKQDFDSFAAEEQVMGIDCLGPASDDEVSCVLG